MIPSMLLRLDSESGVPFYSQVARQIKQTIASGALLPGDRLPTVRELASELVLNPNTVARAYQELERQGVVETRRGLGTFACEPASRLDKRQRARIVSDLLEHAVVEAVHLEIGQATVRHLLELLLAERYANPPRTAGRGGPGRDTSLTGARK